LVVVTAPNVPTKQTSVIKMLYNESFTYVYLLFRRRLAFYSVGITVMHYKYLWITEFDYF